MMPSIPPSPPVDPDTAADDTPKKPWTKPEIRRMRVRFTLSGPAPSDPNANEDPRYQPGPSS